MGFSYIIEESTALTFPVRELMPIYKQELGTVLIEKKTLLLLLTVS